MKRAGILAAVLAAAVVITPLAGVTPKPPAARARFTLQHTGQRQAARSVLVSGR